MKSFALIGAAGYIAPRHMNAMRETGNDLIAALDPNDSVGILDSYFPDASFFTEFERFDRHLDKLRRRGQGADYVAICSPNYLHDSHIRFALRSNADAICEKPLVLNPWNIESLADIERETGRRIYSILQLRLHPAILALKGRVESQNLERKHEVDLSYVTSRGRWYAQSWKANKSKAGGIATNIGIHFFDMLNFVFGAVQRNEVHLYEDQRAAGFLEFEKARVRWFLSIDAQDLPAKVQAAGTRTWRSIMVDGEEVEFSGGFADLHTLSYEKILQGQGFGLESSLPAIEAVSFIRTAPAHSQAADRHPLAQTG